MSDLPGYYDHDKFVAPLLQHDDADMLRATIWHESLHAHLDRSTGHGLLMRQIQAGLKCGTDVPQTPNALRFLEKSSVVVHETFANYVSIRSLGRDPSTLGLATVQWQYYQQMAALVEPVFGLRLGTTLFAEAISKTCMMNRLWELCNTAKDFSLPFIKANVSTKELPNSVWDFILQNAHLIEKDAIFARFSARWDMTQYEPLLQAENYVVLKESLDLSGGDDDAVGLHLSNYVANFTVGLMHVLFDILETEYPDLEENYSYYRICKAATATLEQNKYSELGTDLTSLYMVFSNIRDQKVKVFDIDPSDFMDLHQSDEALLRRVMREQVSLFSTYNGYLMRIGSHLALYLVGIDRGRIAFYTLSPKDLASQHFETYDFTTVMEEDNFELLHGAIRKQLDSSVTLPESTWQALRQPFVMVRRDPAEFLNDKIRQGCSLIAAVFAITYAQGHLASLSGLQMCIYEVAGREEVYFHLANDVLSKSIMRLIDVIARPEALRYDVNLVAAKANRLRKLVDHPIMNIYYTGSVPSWRTTIIIKSDDEFALGTRNELMSVES